MIPNKNRDTVTISWALESCIKYINCKSIVSDISYINVSNTTSTFIFMQGNQIIISYHVCTMSVQTGLCCLRINSCSTPVAIKDSVDRLLTNITDCFRHSKF